MDNYYCLFCQTGHEFQVAARLEQIGLESMIAQANRIVFTKGVEKKVHRQLLQSYVFFKANTLDPDKRMAVSNVDRVIKLLSYEDNECALIGKDALFVEWLWKHGGVLDVSRAFKEGDRIRILDGPLRDFEGQIVQVNLKRKSVAVQVGGQNLSGKIWCSIEMIDYRHENGSN